MRCDEFETRLQDLLDDRRSPQSDRAVCEHARHCPHCQRQMLAFQSIVAAFARPASAAAARRFSQSLPPAGRTIEPRRLSLAVPPSSAMPTRRAGVRSMPAWAATAAALASIVALLSATQGIGNRQPSLDSLSMTESAPASALAATSIERSAEGTSHVNAAASQLDPEWLLKSLETWEQRWGNAAWRAEYRSGGPWEGSLSSLTLVADTTTSALDALWQKLAIIAEDARS